MVNHLTRLDECYERGLLRKVAASNDKAMQSLAQAREWVIEAGYDSHAGSLRSALMAAYMGYFHVWIESTYRFVINEDTGEPEIVGVSRDITEKKALEM